MGIESYLAIAGAPAWLSIKVLVSVLLIDLALRGYALYVSAREEKHPGFFISLLVLNTIGIWPLIYLLFVRKRKR